MTSDTKETKQRPTLEQVQEELRGTFVAIGVLLNECFYPGSGDRLIGVPLAYRGDSATPAIDLSKTEIGRYLPIYYRYAYEGKMTPGYESELDDYGENIERLVDFASMFVSDSAYFDLCLDVAGLDVATDVGHLRDMLDRLRARLSLDSGSSLSVREIALLADMSERSVRNAMTADGSNRLVASKDGIVENLEAHRWLEGRRGFVKTERRQFPESLKDCPDQLDALEIPAFVRDRLLKRFPEQPSIAAVALEAAASPSHDGAYDSYPEIIELAARVAGLPAKTIQDALQQPLRIRPEDCVGLAKLLVVDPVWFTLQVMQALFPTSMDMVLNPSHYRSDVAEVQVEGKSVDVVLTEAMIKHGYLDVPAHAKVLFPDDCFGTRATDDKGKSIELRYGDHAEATDIRVKSEQTISPRKRFTAWFQKEIAASAGDRIRVTRIAERVFELTHLPK